LKQWDNTGEWGNYQTGLDFNNRLDLYSKTDLYWNFYNDKHWEGVTTNGLPTFTLNIGKAAINYFIASITSQKIKQQFSVENLPDEPTDEADLEIKQFIEYLNGYLDIKWDIEKMDFKVKQLLLDAAVGGDMCLHVYWNPDIETGQDEKGDFEIETIDGVNILFGNPNNPEVEKQPYILIIGREMVSKLREEAKANGISQNLIDSITSDSDYNYQAGAQGKYELDVKGDDGKCLYLIKYWKKDGTVYWNKSTRYCPIRKDVDLGIKKYPVAFNNWFKVKNCYHGFPVMAGVIDNQIVINQLFAMVAYWMRMSAFGKVIFNSTKIASWTNTIGKAIAATGDVNGIVTQLRSGDFNNGILEVINLAIKYTKDVIGASDSALGLVKPENTSAIIAVAKQAAIPLQNPQDNLYRLIDDLTLIEGEFILKKYRERKISYRKNSKIMVTNINTEKFRNLLLRAKTDVGPSSYWSEITSIQTLDNLLINDKINVLQYLERVPEGIIPKRQELVEEIRQQMEQAQLQQQQQMEYEQMAKFVDSLPSEQQAQLEQLRQTNPEQYEEVIKQMMRNNQSAETVQAI
jgi:hypothetical protein